MKVFVFNYGLLDKAIKMNGDLLKVGADSYVLSSPHKSDKPTKDNRVVIYEKNMFYAGLYNEALAMSDGNDFMIINSDNIIKDYKRLYDRASTFFSSYRAPGIYAPSINVGGTYWRYMQDMIGYADACRNWKRVPITDGTCWAISGKVAAKTGPVNLIHNRIGWGIDVVAAMNAIKMGLHVVVDYDIEIIHPAKESYDINSALKEEMIYATGIGIMSEYLAYKEAARKLTVHNGGSK